MVSGMTNYDESKHVRGQGGKFAPKPSATATPEARRRLGGLAGRMADPSEEISMMGETTS